MLKWLITITFVIAGLLACVSPVRADTSQSVTVTASGYVGGAPGLMVTWISDIEVRLDWTMGAGTVNTMVRAKIGSIPTSRTDGYLVYTGNLTTFTDTSMNLDEMATALYYRAWGQNALGVWEETGSTGFVEGVGMILIALGFLAVALMAVAYWIRRPAVGIGAGTMWLLIAVYSFTKSTSTWDFYFGLYVIAIGMAIVAMMEGFVLKPKEDVHDQMMDDDSDWKAWDEGQKHFNERMNLRRKSKRA